MLHDIGLLRNRLGLRILDGRCNGGTPLRAVAISSTRRSANAQADNATLALCGAGRKEWHWQAAGMVYQWARTPLALKRSVSERHDRRSRTAQRGVRSGLPRGLAAARSKGAERRLI